MLIIYQKVHCSVLVTDDGVEVGVKITPKLLRDILFYVLLLLKTQT